jgi:hypothetical protein
MIACDDGPGESPLSCQGGHKGAVIKGTVIKGTVIKGTVIKGTVIKGK